VVGISTELETEGTRQQGEEREEKQYDLDMKKITVMGTTTEKWFKLHSARLQG